MTIKLKGTAIEIGKEIVRLENMFIIVAKSKLNRHRNSTEIYCLNLEVEWK